MTKETIIQSPDGLSQYLNGVNFRKELSDKQWNDGEKKRFLVLVDEIRQQLQMVEDRTDIPRAVGEQFTSGSIGMGEIIKGVLEEEVKDIPAQLDILQDRLNEFKKYSRSLDGNRIERAQAKAAAMNGPAADEHVPALAAPSVGESAYPSQQAMEASENKMEKAASKKAAQARREPAAPLPHEAKVQHKGFFARLKDALMG